jgi:sugar lactone lactonase YvrE
MNPFAAPASRGTVLVTGAAGCIGRETGRALQADGWTVIGCDLRPAPAAGFPITVVDLRDPATPPRLLRGCTALVHLASHAHDSTAPLFEENTALDEALLRAALAAGAGTLVFASSIQVSGAGADSRPPARLPLDGRAPARPVNAYARAKAVTEERLRRLAEERPGLSVVALRFPWIAPPEDRAAARRRHDIAIQRATAFAFLPVEQVGGVVAAVLRAAPAGYHCYLPAARENLLWLSPERVRALHYPNLPAFAGPGLAYDAALENDTGWRPAPVPWRPFCPGGLAALHRLRRRCRALVRRLLAPLPRPRPPVIAEATLLFPAAARLGEGPFWDAARARLLWVDARAGTVHRLDPVTGRDEALPLGDDVSTVAPAGGDRVLVALRDSLAWADFATRTVEPHAAGRFEGPPNRLNDGKCDAAGRLWIGSMNIPFRQRTGALFLVHPDGRVERKLEGVLCSNGLGWSADGRTLHYIDSGNRALEAFAFDAVSGSLGARRTVVRFPVRLGVPDGLCLDEDGAVWVALYGGGAVARVDAARGRITGLIRVPTRNVTSCAFGGADGRDLFITSAREGLSEAVLAREPLAGALFVARPGPRGRAVFGCAGGLG